jgi:hypothetical protein
MTSLTPEAYAVIEGRHSDPFRYLGPHVENGSSVVRVFLPDAEGVAVIDEQGHESDLQRIHDAGLFEGRLRNGSRHYRLRARYGERQPRPSVSDPSVSPIALGILGFRLQDPPGECRPAGLLVFVTLAHVSRPFAPPRGVLPVLRGDALAYYYVHAFRYAPPAREPGDATRCGRWPVSAWG